jgi:hypothetical protein
MNNSNRYYEKLLLNWSSSTGVPRPIRPFGPWPQKTGEADPLLLPAAGGRWGWGWEASPCDGGPILGWRVAGCSPEWASGGEEFGDGEEASGGADKRSPMGFFGPERISGRRGSLRCCQLCRRKTEGVGRWWARAEEGGSVDLWLGLQQGAKEVAGDGEVGVGSAASGEEAKWATVWRRKRRGEWLLALPKHEDKQGGTCGAAGWPAATGGTSAEASHRCECGQHGMTAQKAGARGPQSAEMVMNRLGCCPVSQGQLFNFSLISIWPQLWNSKTLLSQGLKVLKLCMMLDMKILNNFIYWPNFKFPLDIML